MKGPRKWDDNISKVLEEWLQSHKDNPYPSKDEKLRMMNETGLKLKQVCVP